MKNIIKFNGKEKISIWNFLVNYNTFFIFVLLVIISSCISDVFFTEKNIFNLLRQLSGLIVVSIGMLMVILHGGIDLSVGSILALTSVTSAYFIQNTGMLPIAIVITIGIGILVGVISGYLVSFHNMPPFVTTLAMMTISRGLAYIISKGSPILIGGSAGEGLLRFGDGYFLHIPYPVYLATFAIVFSVILMKYTKFGRLALALGSNETAVNLSGINVKWYKFALYVFSGGFASLAGIIATSRTGVGSPLVGNGFELDAIAAVVIGGASLAGGKGTVINTLMGVLILGMIGNIMNLINVPAYPQQVIKGLIILGAVFMQISSNKKKHKAV